MGRREGQRFGGRICREGCSLRTDLKNRATQAGREAEIQDNGFTRMNAKTLALAIAVILSPLANGEDIQRPRFLNPYPISDPRIVEDIATPALAGSRSFFMVKGEPLMTRPYVRVGYVIPSNRSEQPQGVATIRYVITTYQNWLGDQMQHHGEGPRTFVYETEPDGLTPTVHLIRVSETDGYIREDIWGHTLSAVSSAGVALWNPGEVWLLFVEAHVQSPDGDVVGGVALGASWGSGDDPGVAMLGGDALAILRPEFSTDDRPYHGTVLPEIGPYPLQEDISFQWFEGTTFSSVHSSLLGAGMHELGHALGLPHDFRNDNNFHGNLMGNGLRGFRGCTHPGRYSSDFTRLSHVAALVLGRSRYLNEGRKDAIRPTLSVSTQGTVSLAGGFLPIQFSAFDGSGLAGAMLVWEGDVVGEMILSGKNAAREFATEYFDPGVAKNYAVVVFDAEGNRTSQEVSITASAKSNSAPRPFVKVAPPLMSVGESSVLDASDSTDPNQSSATLRVEWDVDGDGVFDTAPTTTKTLTMVGDIPGPVAILARITDELGASTISTPMFIDPHLPVVKLGGAAGSLIMKWESAFGFTYQVEQSATLRTWAPKGLPLLYGSGLVQEYQPPPSGARAQFLRFRIGKRQD